MNIERKRDMFDEIRDHLCVIQNAYKTLCDTDSTAKQRRAIVRASDELTSYEKVVVAKLKKKLGC